MAPMLLRPSALSAAKPEAAGLEGADSVVLALGLQRPPGSGRDREKEACSFWS